ncbi:MAG: hypothetical protein AAF798_18230 [Bacteroidota bacterium]
MTYKVKVFLVMFLLAAITSNSGCIKEECSVGGGYEFVVPATLSPALRTYRIGDTITIRSAFEHDVYELKTERTYRLENFRFFPSTEIKKIDEDPIQNSLSPFEIIVAPTFDYEILTFSSGNQALVGEYNYNGTFYTLEYQLIPKQTGLFYLEQGISTDLDEDQGFEAKCNNVDISVGKVSMNNDADNNIDLFNDIPDTEFGAWILGRPEWNFQWFGGYVIEVVE